MRAPLVLVTAGPTREKIDPVRFISNYSTGTFGYAIASEAKRRGCRVILVTGPVSIRPPAGVKTIRVESARDMLKAVLRYADKADYIFMAAAVSDWRVRDPRDSKIKRGTGKAIISLVENPDIVKELGKRKKYILTGFALETGALTANAIKKLDDKKLDMIVANRLEKGHKLFGDNKISITIIDKYGRKSHYGKASKKALAKIILDKAFAFNI